LRRELEATKTDLDTQRQNYLSQQARLEAKTKESDELGKDLVSMRGKFEEKSQHCQQLVQQIENAEHEKAGLTEKLDAARELVNKHENSIRSLESHVRDCQTDAERLQSLLRSETAQREQEQARVAALSRQATELNAQLTEKAAEQQRSQQRESELNDCIRRQEEELGSSKITAANLEAELKTLRSVLDDMNIIQSALCARVRELTSQQDADVKRLRESLHMCTIAGR